MAKDKAKPANSDDYCRGYGDGWRAGWHSAMDHVHVTVSAALGAAGSERVRPVTEQYSGTSCGHCGHTDYCDGWCEELTEVADG